MVVKQKSLPGSHCVFCIPPSRGLQNSAEVQDGSNAQHCQSVEAFCYIHIKRLTCITIRMCQTMRTFQLQTCSMHKQSFTYLNHVYFYYYFFPTSGPFCSVISAGQSQSTRVYNVQAPCTTFCDHTMAAHVNARVRLTQASYQTAAVVFCNGWQRFPGTAVTT